MNIIVIFTPRSVYDMMVMLTKFGSFTGEKTHTNKYTQYSCYSNIVLFTLCRTRCQRKVNVCWLKLKKVINNIFTHTYVCDMMVMLTKYVLIQVRKHLQISSLNTAIHIQYYSFQLWQMLQKSRSTLGENQYFWMLEISYLILLYKFIHRLIRLIHLSIVLVH